MSNERVQKQAVSFKTAVLSSSAQGNAVNMAEREYIPMETLYKWVKLAKSQALVIELLKLELDTLSDTIETGTSSITTNFYELTGHFRACGDEDLIAEASKSLSQVIRSLQYQDLASQLIDNICNTLKTLGLTFDFLLKETSELDHKGFDSLSPDEAYLNQIISERTLGEMRNRMTKNLEKISEVAAQVQEGEGLNAEDLMRTGLKQDKQEQKRQEPDTATSKKASSSGDSGQEDGTTIELF